MDHATSMAGTPKDEQRCRQFCAANDGNCAQCKAQKVGAAVPHDYARAVDVEGKKSENRPGKNERKEGNAELLQRHAKEEEHACPYK